MVGVCRSTGDGNAVVSEQFTPTGTIVRANTEPFLCAKCIVEAGCILTHPPEENTLLAPFY